MWKYNIVYKGKIKVVTGLHIGAGKESLKIGGTDNPVITTKISYKEGDAKERTIEIPYIPGSSIKGKMKSLLTLIEVDPSWRNLIYTVFGSEKSKEDTSSKFESDWQTRIIVRDAFPTSEWIKKIADFDFYNGGIEIKGENTIDRTTGKANPRFMERVIPGMEFELEIIVSIFDTDDVEKIKKLIKTGIELLEDSYLGGNGSRGYGKVEFDLKELEIRDLDYYRKKLEDRG
ncbi:MAG: type III-A CRISPR-associated RAMP protein Csm3 [Thermoplasmata archaeon]